MSIKASIGMTLPNKMVVSINCYSDGAPDFLGQILARHYNTEDKIKELMKRGNLLYIDITPQSCTYEQQTRKFNFTECCPIIYKNLDIFLTTIDKSRFDFGYIFHQGKWYVYDPNEK